MRRSVATLTSFCMLAGCASQPEDINPQYVSPAQYQSYNCRQIEAEMQRVSSRVREVTGQQKSEADGDAVALGVGLVLFWPALFFMIGKDQEEELARLKGEYEALETASIQKDCVVTQEAGSEEASYNPVAAYAAPEDLETPNWSSPDVYGVANSDAERANVANKPLSEKARTAETAYWQAIKDSNDPKDFETYLKTFPNGQFVGQARSHLVQTNTPSEAELALWNSVKNSTDPAEYAVYLNAYPQGSFSEIAVIRHQRLRAALNAEARRGKFVGHWAGTGSVAAGFLKCAKFYTIEADIDGSDVSGRFEELGANGSGKGIYVEFTGKVDEAGNILIDQRRFELKGSIEGHENTGEGTWKARDSGCRGHFEIAKN